MKKAILFLILLSPVIILNAQTINIGDSIYTSKDNGNTLQLAEVDAYNYNADCLDTLFHITSFDPFTNAATTSQTLYTYYPNQAIYQSILQNGTGDTNTYINSTRTTLTYTAAQLVPNITFQLYSTVLTESWNGTQWHPSTFETYHRNASGNDTVDLTQTWDDSMEKFINQNQSLTFYNEKGLKIKYETESWDTASSSWMISYVERRYYDKNGYLIESSDQDFDIATGQSLHYDSSVNYNNNKGLVDSSIEYTPYGLTLQKNYYTYYADSLPKQYTGYDYQDSGLQSISRVDYIFDRLNNILLDTMISRIASAPSFTFRPNNILASRFTLNPDKTFKNYVYSSFYYMDSTPIESSYRMGNISFAPCTASTLPVTLLNFNAIQNNKDAAVRWQVANETNVSYYNVLRSTDGVHFIVIGKVWASGNRVGENSYNYIDANIKGLAVSKLYYRLSEQDRNGTVIYSKIVELDRGNETLSVSIAPNPVQNVITIYSPATLLNASILITDMNGSILYASRQNMAAGGKLAIDASRLAKGMYIVTIQSQTGKQVCKITK